MSSCKNILPGNCLVSIIFRILQIIFLVYPCNCFCQISVPGTPESFSLIHKKNFAIPEKILGSINIDSLLKEDSEKGISNRYSILKELNINLRDSSLKTEIPGKGYIWQYKLKIETAFSLGLLFKTYRLPEGASIFIYTPDHNQILGAFTSLNNNPLKMLTIADLKNNTAIIEYFEPYFPDFPGELVLGPVSIAYRDIMMLFSEGGRIGINCPMGEDWQDDKNSVCKITFRDDEGARFCTGFLVNNAREDLTPYFITALHCISSEYSASTMVAYFNYENSGCEIFDPNDSHTVSGSILLAKNADSDFTLLLLNNIPPADYKAYLAGWDVSKHIPLRGTGIHHPMGQPKCITKGSKPLNLVNQSLMWVEGENSKPNTHWHVEFESGNMEEGSSGSPIFDDNHRVVGQLHGGIDPNYYYGAFKASWDQNSNTVNQLKNWLDPDDTEIRILDGRYLNEPPRADFFTSFKKVCLNNTFTLNDNSRYEPIKWEWNFNPSTIIFVNGTSETSSNPEVMLTATGNYSVKLVATNQWGSDSIFKTDFITVIDNISLGIKGIPPNNKICGGDLNDIPFTVSGAREYTFSISNPEKVQLIPSSDIAFLSLMPDQKKYGNFTSVLTVSGSLGTCTNTDTIILEVMMPINDDINDAKFLHPGKNGPFSNYCASGQSEEAFPPDFYCHIRSSWCPGSTHNGIQNSIWFTFIGPSDGKITIDTKGLNDRIAVYEADSSQQIISGSPLNYRIIGANDDRSYSDSTAWLENLVVTPGKKYWLQVESLDADTGDIYISLLTNIFNSFEVFPNPSSGIINLILPDNSEGLTQVFIYSSTGKLLYYDQIEVSGDSKHFTINFVGATTGLYFLQLRTAGKVFSKNILLLY
jgi:PKD repeat protein